MIKLVILMIGDAFGGIAQIDYHDDVQSITIAPDKRTAEVVQRYKLDVAGSVMNISGTSRDTLGVRMGRIVVVRSESNDRVQGGRRR